jgi:hypothetical protein
MASCRRLVTGDGRLPIGRSSASCPTIALIKLLANLAHAKTMRHWDGILRRVADPPVHCTQVARFGRLTICPGCLRQTYPAEQRSRNQMSWRELSAVSDQGWPVDNRPQIAFGQSAPQQLSASAKSSGSSSAKRFRGLRSGCLGRCQVAATVERAGRMRSESR